MKTNVGTMDRILRLLLAAIFAGLYFAEIVQGVAGTIVLALAAIFTLTAAIGFCPLYTLFGLNTCPAKK
jgi:hypothetical protein